MFSRTPSRCSGLIGTFGAFGSSLAIFRLIDERGWRHTQTTCYLVDVREGNIRFAALNASHVRPVHAAAVGQLFLRYSSLRAKCPHPLAECTCNEIRH